MLAAIKISTEVNSMFFRKSIITLGILSLSSLTACGGGGGSDDASSASQFGDLNLSVTDAPVDDATVVNVRFDAITVKPKNGSAVTISDLEATNINLLDYTGGQSRILLQTEGDTNLQLPAGEYNWMRFDVSDTAGDSYIVIDGNQYDLTVPSGELKLNKGFTIPVDGVANFTVDFDLRHSIVNSNGNTYKLKPVLRLLDNTLVGTLSGTVDGTLVADCDGVDDVAAVYLFSGELTVGQLGDMGSIVSEEVEPLITVAPSSDAGDYTYAIGFLTAGTYTVAYTCDADDSEADDEVSFSLLQTAIITAETTTVVNFEPLVFELER